MGFSVEVQLRKGGGDAGDAFFKVFFIYAHTILRTWTYAHAILVIRNMPMQFFSSPFHALFYISWLVGCLRCHTILPYRRVCPCYAFRSHVHILCHIYLVYAAPCMFTTIKKLCSHSLCHISHQNMYDIY
jgi:hypothetical protein